MRLISPCAAQLGHSLNKHSLLHLTPRHPPGLTARTSQLLSGPATPSEATHSCFSHVLLQQQGPRASSVSRRFTVMASAAESQVSVQVHCDAQALAPLQKAASQIHGDGVQYQFSFHAAGSSPPSAAQQQPTPSSAFSGQACMAGLRSQVVGRTMLVTPEITSTQDFMRANCISLGDGAVMIADRQTSGKGRGGNVWTSPDGCLMFSVAKRLKVASPAQAPFINYIVCLAVRQGIMDALEPLLQGAPPPPVRIKWPNDIYAHGLKIGGALIHTTWQTDRFNVVTGVGLNVNNRTPTTCLDILLAQALAAHRGQPAPADVADVAAWPADHVVSREAVLAGVLNRLEEYYNVFESEGFGPLQPLYLAAWLHGGQQLTFQDTDPGDPAGPPKTTRLTIQGLSPSGYMLAVDEWGAPHELTPDGNSLDMMAGLIKRKIM